MSAVNIRKAIEEAQLKISEYGVAEAKAKKEKAEVELETAKIQQRAVLKLVESDSTGSGYAKRRGGIS